MTRNVLLRDVPELGGKLRGSRALRGQVQVDQGYRRDKRTKHRNSDQVWTDDGRLSCERCHIAATAYGYKLARWAPYDMLKSKEKLFWNRMLLNSARSNCALITNDSSETFRRPAL
ncbi:hypothetical protein PHSY_005651 [Pseudozyma hubeiensis SY62]|uniref:Uncharacterized protein n=1 Tax=Pseudozyma hubeiensis (strain SY62) TaxID=1305764 RepID=R9P9Y0_PSEHS|nr:hypothetical protein PHSY_005651 [Pseudozyma hubeiensis SY62]GAC98062.1 hypothetical protein PHSY_005651 [Pseudozyma hubeiensis SY62]